MIENFRIKRETNVIKQAVGTQLLILSQKVTKNQCICNNKKMTQKSELYKNYISYR